MNSINIPMVLPLSPWYNGPGWPPITPTYDEIEMYKDWCKEFVGVDRWNYYGIHKKTPCEFRFKDPKDLLAFRLRFGLW